MPDAEASYNLALDYLYSFVDYSLKHSSELAKADFNLDRMRMLDGRARGSAARYPILHVAGTKGKGSVCALAASGLQAAGYRVGLYTSPHLLDYCERIQINGRRGVARRACPSRRVCQTGCGARTEADDV